MVLCVQGGADGQGHIHASDISSCLKNKGIQRGIAQKGIYALRRTVNSKMRCDSVSATATDSLLGHTKEVNE